jgi:hypothetical protein
MGPYAKPDSASFANYYNFTDLTTENIMIVSAGSPSADNTLVTCRTFFVENSLAFQANNSVSVNVWTNLGQPLYITNGVWNSDNCTSTLTLNASSIGEISWGSFTITTYTDSHSNVSPSNSTVPYEGNQTFNFSSTEGYRNQTDKLAATHSATLLKHMRFALFLLY